MLRTLVEQRVPRPGTRWKTRGRFFKHAGWREARLVVVWAPGHTEPLGVLTDRPPRWKVVHHYRRRFWIEAGFRSDKTKGWHWEASHVQGLAQHERLLLAMAWATLLLLCLGAQAAPRVLAAATRHRSAPRHARASLFTLGLQQARRWFDRRLTHLVPWRLPDLDADCWNAQLLGAQIHERLFPSLHHHPSDTPGLTPALRLLTPPVAPPNDAA